MTNRRLVSSRSRLRACSLWAVANGTSPVHGGGKCDESRGIPIEANAKSLFVIQILICETYRRWHYKILDNIEKARPLNPTVESDHLSGFIATQLPAFDVSTLNDLFNYDESEAKDHSFFLDNADHYSYATKDRLLRIVSLICEHPAYFLRTPLDS